MVILFPMQFQFVAKDVELLVVHVLIDCCFPFQAIDNKFKTYLGISHSNSNVFLEEITITFSLPLFPIFIDFLHQNVNFFIRKIQNILLQRIKEPILSTIPSFDSKHAHPMIGDGKHETNDERFFIVVILEVVDQFGQIFSLLFGDNEILELELPCEGVQFELIMLPEDFEICESFKTQFVVGSLEISIDDVLHSPRPFILQLFLNFDLGQKLLHSFFEIPKRCTIEYVVIGLSFSDHIEETQGVKSSVISAEIRSILLVAFGLMDVIDGVVGVWDEIGDGERRDIDVRIGDSIQNIIQQFVPQLSNLLGHDGDDDSLHVKTYYTNQFLQTFQQFQPPTVIVRLTFHINSCKIIKQFDTFWWS